MPGSAPTLDALFVIMGREDLYPVVRDDLFLFLAFLLVCGVVILIVTNVQQDLAEAAARPRPVTPPPPVEPEPDRPETGPHPGPESHSDNARALTSPRTGLVWADYLEPRLRAELSRAAAADLDIALAKIRIDEPFADAKLPIVHASIAAILRESFPLHDLMFESGNDSYTVLLPDTDVDAAVRNLEAFRKTVAGAAVEGRMRSVSVGVSSRGGRLIEDSTLIEEADVSLAKASREGGNQVIGFRADPSRFRDTLDGDPHITAAGAARPRREQPVPPYMPRAFRSSATASSFIVNVCSSAGKDLSLHIGDVLLHGSELDRVKVRVHLHELRREAFEQPHHVVEDKHLPVAIEAAADADGGDLQLLRDEPRELSGYGLQDDRENARLFEGHGIVHDLFRLVEGLALDLESAQHSRSLRRQPDVAEHGDAGLDDCVHRRRPFPGRLPASRCHTRHPCKGCPRW